LDKLEGSARRNAEQTIRLELLYQRAADATGAFRAQSGNLYVEQKKLQAAWENMQATVGTQLLPAMGGLVEVLKPLVDELTPRLVQVVTDAGPAIQTLTEFIKDLGDEATTTGQTASFISDSIGTFFRILSENFGVITQAALLIGGLRVAFILLTAAMNATPIGWAVTGLGLLAGAFLLVNDAAKKAEINTRQLNKQFVDNPWQQAANPARVYSGILSDVIRKDLDPHSKNIEEIKKAWTRAERSAFDYSKVARTAATSRPLKGGRQAEDFFATQDLRLGIDPDGKDDNGEGSAAKKEPSIMQTLKQEATKSRLAGKLISKNLSAGLAEQITDKGPKAARNQLKKIRESNGEHAKKLQRIYNRTAAGKAELDRIQAALDAKNEEQKRKDDAIAEELAEKERARLEEQKRVYDSFLNSVKSTFAGIRDSIMGAFDIKELGGSTNSIIRNMNKLLTKVKDFSKNISQLATMGLDPALLQQVIQAGPMAGARLASALVAGGAGALGQINAGFGQIGSLASEIATVGTQSLFGQGKQETIYNINVSGGVGSGATIGKAIVDAIKDYERTSGAVWQGA
jgi:hypothetical protein